MKLVIFMLNNDPSNQHTNIDSVSKLIKENSNILAKRTRKAPTPRGLRTHSTSRTSNVETTTLSRSLENKKSKELSSYRTFGRRWPWRKNLPISLWWRPLRSLLRRIGFQLGDGVTNYWLAWWPRWGSSWCLSRNWRRPRTRFRVRGNQCRRWCFGSRRCSRSRWRWEWGFRNRRGIRRGPERQSRQRTWVGLCEWARALGWSW